MLDIQQLRRDLPGVTSRLQTRKNPQPFLDVERFSALEAERKAIQTRTEELQAQRNSFSKQIGQLKAKGEDTAPLMAQVGGIGIAPGANMSDSVACFEATHGTAPKYAGKDYVNPGSEILSAEMMLRHMGWTEAADLIISSMERAILTKRVTYDFARLMEGATQVSCSGFGQVMIDQM